MTEYVLLGDSVFDNERYVEAGQSTPEILSQLSGFPVKNYAVDGAIIEDVYRQIDMWLDDEGYTPTQEAVLSVGGNDLVHILSEFQGQDNLDSSILVMDRVLYEFEKEYRELLSYVLERVPQTILFRVQTVYEADPTTDVGLYGRVLIPAFNLKIMKLAEEFGYDVLRSDLALVDEEDFTKIIEPSAQGSYKLARLIHWGTY